MLNFLCLKFLVIWRLSRGWALLDGVESPENVARHLLHNYDVEGVRKHWHASLNRWLVRAPQDLGQPRPRSLSPRAAHSASLRASGF